MPKTEQSRQIKIYFHEKEPFFLDCQYFSGNYCKFSGEEERSNSNSGGGRITFIKYPTMLLL